MTEIIAGSWVGTVRAAAAAAAAAWMLQHVNNCHWAVVQWLDLWSANFKIGLPWARILPGWWFTIVFLWFRGLLMQRLCLYTITPIQYTYKLYSYTNFKVLSYSIPTHCIHAQTLQYTFTTFPHSTPTASEYPHRLVQCCGSSHKNRTASDRTASIHSQFCISNCSWHHNLSNKRQHCSITVVI